MLRRHVGSLLVRSVRRLGFEVIRVNPDESAELSDAEKSNLRIWEQVRPFTLTSRERIFALCDAVRYLVRNEIPGSYVECGVWKGGSMMAVALTLLSLGVDDRDLWLFDTFEGMTAPGELDVDLHGKRASDEYQRREGNWAQAPLTQVENALLGTGYKASRVHFVKGKVEDTLPARAPDTLALLRLDTDWYESTKHELTHLFPRLSRGGVLIVDDYGHYLGARQATDEYLEEAEVPILLNKIDYTGRIAVRI